VANGVVFMEEGRIVEQATPPIKPVGNSRTGTSPGLPTDKIVPRALMDVIAVASLCPRDQIPSTTFTRAGCGAVRRA
jgi:hypothetical protein